MPILTHFLFILRCTYVGGRDGLASGNAWIIWSCCCCHCVALGRPDPRADYKQHKLLFYPNNYANKSLIYINKCIIKETVAWAS